MFCSGHHYYRHLRYSVVVLKLQNPRNSKHCRRDHLTSKGVIHDFKAAWWIRSNHLLRPSSLHKQKGCLTTLHNQHRSGLFKMYTSSSNVIISLLKPKTHVSCLMTNSKSMDLSCLFFLLKYWLYLPTAFHLYSILLISMLGWMDNSTLLELLELRFFS